jgi:hypothetical protein
MKRLLLASVFALALALLADGWHASAQVGPSPLSGVPVSNSSGNVAAATATATLPAVANKVTYICGFAATSGGSTAAATVNLTVVGVTGGTMTYSYSTSTGVDAPSAPLVVTFGNCLPATAPNTTIVVSMPTLGAGNAHAAVNAWGFQR